ncbi:MAG TPA: HAD family hydrolase [Bacillota bacterium]|nr:HAD family hydrolase [Bacillota bacterium]HPT87163.1 HAD family hydrolase [Bacillota bacterium]
MDFSTFKLLVFDLDGTLVPYGSDELSLKTIEALRAFSQTHRKFTIATGRSFYQSKSIIDKLGITVPVIVQTGALIVDPVSGKILRSQPLNPVLHRQLQDIAGRVSADHLILGEDGVYYPTRSGVQCRNWLLQSGERCSVVGCSSELPVAIKHLFVGSEEQIREVAELVKTQADFCPHLILWPPDQGFSDWFLEVFDSSASKGQALVWLAEKLGIKMEAVMAFGDGYNDMDMLCRAGLGIAMEKAVSEVRAAAGLTIPGPENDGIADFVTGLIERIA